MLKIIFENGDHVIFFLNGDPNKAGIYRGGDKLVNFSIKDVDATHCHKLLAEEAGQQGLIVVKGGGNGLQPHFFIKAQ